MEFKTYKPERRLASVVKFYWSLDGKLPPTEMYIHRTLANHCPEIIFHYGSDFEDITSTIKIEKTFRFGVHGQTDMVRRFTSRDTCGIFGVMLQPYAIPMLFKVSATEIKNELVDINLLLGQGVKDISDQMMLTNNNEERIVLMNRFLGEQVSEINQVPVIRSIHSICNEKGNLRIKRLANESCFSQRQFERKFKDLTGFSPKAFSRLVRFKSIVDNNSHVHAKSMTEISYDFGYYDQSHFINDFKQYSGYSPKLYFEGQAKDIFYAPK